MLTNAPVRVVSLFDPNLDIERTDPETLLEYREHRPTKLPEAKPGTKLTVYTLRRLSRHIVIRHVHGQPEHERNMWAFQLSIERVENLRAEDGSTTPLWTPTTSFATPTGRIAVVDERELDLFPIAAIEEIGALAYQHAFLGRMSGAWSRLPLSCRAEWDEQVHRLAGTLVQTRARASSEEREGSPPQTSASDGAEPIAATATASRTSRSGAKKTKRSPITEASSET